MEEVRTAEVEPPRRNPNALVDEAMLVRSQRLNGHAPEFATWVTAHYAQQAVKHLNDPALGLPDDAKAELEMALALATHVMRNTTPSRIRAAALAVEMHVLVHSGRV